MKPLFLALVGAIFFLPMVSFSAGIESEASEIQEDAEGIISSFSEGNDTAMCFNLGSVRAQIRGVQLRLLTKETLDTLEKFANKEYHQAEGATVIPVSYCLNRTNVERNTLRGPLNEIGHHLSLISGIEWQDQ